MLQLEKATKSSNKNPAQPKINSLKELRTVFAFLTGWENFVTLKLHAIKILKFGTALLVKIPPANVET